MRIAVVAQRVVGALLFSYGLFALVGGVASGILLIVLGAALILRPRSTSLGRRPSPDHEVAFERGVAPPKSLFR